MCRKHERGDQHAEPAENKRGAGLILFGTGAVFGATDVGVTVAAKALGSTAAAGPLLGFWGAGLLLGGIAATRLGGDAKRGNGLTMLLGARSLTHPRCAPWSDGMVDRAAPAGTQTEAFSWLGTASSTGGAAGAAVGGALAQSAGVAAFGLAAGGSVLTAMLGSLGLDNDTAEPHGCLLAEAA